MNTQIRYINKNIITIKTDEICKIDEEVILENEIVGRVIEVSEDICKIYIEENMRLNNYQKIRFTKELSKKDLITINPLERKVPSEIIYTKISAIDVLMTLVKGQKLPIFAEPGLNTGNLIYQIIRNTSYMKTVFIGLGLTKSEELFFRQNLRGSHIYINKATENASKRLLLPSHALHEAEKISKTEDVLVIIKDMTNYANSLREFELEQGKIGIRKGYPSYMYSDFAKIYERAGTFKNRKGSLTLIPIVTMPKGDITHPIPDLTGFITEGQIVLRKDIAYPHIDPLPSLSRLMKDVISKNHNETANNLFSSYSKTLDVRDLAYIIGEEALSEEDKSYLNFGLRFEKEFLAQEEFEERTLKESLFLANEILKECFFGSFKT